MAVRASHYHSITELGHTEAFELEVSRGLVGGHSAVNIFGFNETVGTAFVPLWEVAGAYTFPAVADSVTLTSTAGDYGKTVLISGLDAAWDQITETVTLSAAAQTTKSFLRVNTAIMVGSTNTGEVSVIHNDAATLAARIRAGDSKNQASIYSVPDGHSFYLMRIDAFSATTNGASKYLTFRNQVTASGRTLNVAQTTFNNSMQILRQIPFKYSEKSDIQMQIKSSSGVNEAGVFAEGVLIKDTIE